jgi:DNA-binding NarL/FixJ family response regulator
MIRILLADDHVLFRAGTRRILEEQSGFEVIAEAASGIEAVSLAHDLNPDVAIVDIGMKGLNGIEAASQILSRCPSTAVLILSMYGDERYIHGAVRAGARGYLLKDSLEQGLIEAVRCVHSGHVFFSPAVAAILRKPRFLDPGKPSPDDPYDSLTERQRHIYQMLAEGNSSKEVAAQLGLSVHTVETHRTRIMEKMGLHGIAELVLSAVRRGLVS